jgi:hypothetical protein
MKKFGSLVEVMSLTLILFAFGSVAHARGKYERLVREGKIEEAKLHARRKEQKHTEHTAQHNEEVRARMARGDIQGAKAATEAGTKESDKIDKWADRVTGPVQAH